MSFEAVNTVTQKATTPAVDATVLPVQQDFVQIKKPDKELQAQGIFFQPKLTVGAPDDPYEKEADAVADKVMRMPEQNFWQRKCADCEKEEKLHRKPISESITPIVQAKGEGNTTVSNATENTIHSTKGNGSTLDSNTQSFMSTRFGADFSGVKIHTDSEAIQLNRNLNAKAFTAGNDVYFNEGQYQPGSFSGRHLLAHELTHVVQQGGQQKAIMKFGSDEHRRIGEGAVTRNVLVTSYGNISFGEMIAMAGDYFESVEEIAMLAESYGQFGREQIDYVLWKVNQGRPRPPVTQAAIDAVMDRYYRLAARNETHFSTGSSPGNSNRERYIALHNQAIREAFIEGLDPLVIRRWTWDVREAFAQHFLTDSFAAGHIRTQRGNIQRHWNGLYPTFSGNLVQMISCYMASHINQRDNVGYVQTVNQLTSSIEPVIRSQAGNVLAAFSIGDLISKVLHDADNAGLDVISAKGVAGSSGSFRWRAVGDDHLFATGGTTATTAQQQTQQMVSEAVRLSYQEGRQAWSAGASKDYSTYLRLSNAANFKALELIPSEDTNSATNPSYIWSVPNIRALPVNIQSLIVGAFAQGTEIRNGLDSMSVACITQRLGFDLHTRDAFLCFRQKLLSNIWGTIVEIAEGSPLCPPGQNDFCPNLRNPC